MVATSIKCTFSIMSVIIMLASMSVATWAMVEYWYEPDLKADEDYAQSVVDNPGVTSMCIIRSCTRYNDTCKHTEYVYDEDGYATETNSYNYPCGKVQKTYNETKYGGHVSETYEVSINTSELENCQNAGNRTCQYCTKSPTSVYFTLYSCEPQYVDIAGKTLATIILITVFGWIACIVISVAIIVCPHM